MNRWALWARSASLTVGSYLCGPTSVIRLSTLACLPAMYLVKEYKGGNETNILVGPPGTSFQGSAGLPQPKNKSPEIASQKPKKKRMAASGNTSLYRHDNGFWHPGKPAAATRGSSVDDPLVKLPHKGIKRG